ncbi:MAG: prolipoprotein diacylglyceryl transferase, partial [Proteobacteria bacterium]|nr:prolipoprotein diacylglyceryl transferase [Pseudomonadota bacterium]
GVVFPMAGPLPRHPSQLYEAGLEGVILFFVVWIYSASSKSSGRVSGVFLLGYSLMRFIVEFFREPDAHLGLIVGNAISMGQILSIPVALFGFWLLIRPVRP